MLCPVHVFELNDTGVKRISVSLSAGYLPRQMSESGKVLNGLLSYLAIYDRLTNYLVTLDISEGKTPHSFRAGCAITLELASPMTLTEYIKSHI